MADLSPPDAQPAFLQLHDALTAESYARLVLRDPAGAQAWEAHMAQLLAEYHRLIEPAASSEG